MQIGYHKVGLLTICEGRILLCRKARGTQQLILPGGCFEDGETAEACLRRELRKNWVMSRYRALPSSAPIRMPQQANQRS